MKAGLPIIGLDSRRMPVGTKESQRKRENGVKQRQDARARFARLSSFAFVPSEIGLAGLRLGYTVATG